MVKNLVRDGVEIIDLGGESTRPGSHEISYELEKERVVKYLEFLSKTNHGVIISVDTRKSKIAELSVAFTGELSSVVKNEEGEIIEGDAKQVKRQKDTWTFSRDLSSSDPNWLLVATSS